MKNYDFFGFGDKKDSGDAFFADGPNLIKSLP